MTDRTETDVAGARLALPPDRPLIVAEIGNNHEGDPGVARELVLRAAAAGADMVKFQTFRAALFANPADAERKRRLEGFELSFDTFAALADLARAQGVGFCSTPLDLDSARFLAGIADALKIASGDITFLPLLDAVGASGKPVILSTGASTLDEIHHALGRLAGAGMLGDCAVLHCVSAYPVPTDMANLKAIETLRGALPGRIVGYSDHTIGPDAAVLATALGARVIEKHFTLATDYSDFRDHQLSADPAGLAELVRRVAAAAALLGDGEKRVQPVEQPMRPAIRRAIRAARDLGAGETLSGDDILWLRPGEGLAPGQERLVLGRRLARAIAAGAALDVADLESGSD